MTETTPPMLPDCLAPDWATNMMLQERHAQLQHTSLEDYATGMPQAHWDPEGLLHVDTLKHDPYSVADERTAVIVPIPFATGWRPHMAARVDLLNAALGGSNRMIALPNSAHGAPATQYSRKERAAFAQGDYTFLSEKVLRMLEREGIENVSVAGYSQGSVVGASIAKAVAVSGVQKLEAAALSEMPTIVQRSAARLAIDFVRTGMSGYVTAMDGTEIPLLCQSVTPAGRVVAAREFGQYLRTVFLPENVAIGRGLRFATFGSVVLQAAQNNDAQFGFMRAERSTVTPNEPFQGLVRNLEDHLLGRVQSVEIPGYGHEFGDHSVALALVEARVLVKTC